ncbi:MAG: hypothetical protein CL927_12680 [Deltaproteobacteria bacterium]|nr:hypothetical protein [Deltaproteobacteria bacterium]HCH66579.1 hypothetical protein [Deltaproteobacteria bacterium]
MSIARHLGAASVVAMLSACSSGLSIVHEAALAGQFRDARLGDETADVHARFAEVGTPLSGTVVRQEFAGGTVLDQLSMAAGAEFRDVVESDGIRALFIERSDAAPESAILVVATSTAASDFFSSEGASVFDAVLTSDGAAVVLRDAGAGCHMQWLDRQGEATDAVSLDDTLCTHTLRLTAGRPGNTVAFTTDTQTGVATAEGARAWDGGGDLLTWDALSDSVVVAWKGETEIRAWFEDGLESWYTDIGQAVESLDALGGAGVIGLATTVGSNGRIVLLESVTGSAVTAIDVPVPGRAISAGSAGTHVALTLDEELHLFSVDLTGAP